MTRFWLKAAVVAILLVAGVQTLDVAVKTAPWPGTTNRFFHYYQALEEDGQVGSWERLAYSWMLAQSQDEPGPTS